MKTRKDDGSELKKGEYPFEVGDEVFIVEGTDEEMKMLAALESARMRLYMEQNIRQEVAIHLLRRRLKKLGVPEEEYYWAKGEEQNVPNVTIQHFDKSFSKEFVKKTLEARRKNAEDVVVYQDP